jgi:hypothetical protein
MPTSPISDQRQQALVQQAASARGPYGDVAPVQVDHTRLRFCVSADADPQLPARVLALLTVRAELPLQFGFDCVDGERLDLRFELRADMVLYPEQLLDRLLRLPTVREARVLPMAAGIE